MTLHHYPDLRSRNSQGGSDLAFYVKEKLKLHGWTVLNSGTGTSGTTAASDLITTHEGTAIGSMAHANAWYQITDPNGLRELIVQGNTSQLRIWHSRSDGFPLVGHTATVPARQSPVTDEVQIFGTGGAYLNALTGTVFYAIDVIVSDAVVGNTFPFFALGRAMSVSTYSFVWCFEAIDPASMQASDTDTYVGYCSTTEPSPTSEWGTYYAGYGASEASPFANVAATRVYNSSAGNIFPQGSLPVPLYRSRLVPLYFKNVSTGTREYSQAKGVSKHLRLAPYSSAGPGEIFWLENKAYMVAGSILVPVDPGVIPRRPKVI